MTQVHSIQSFGASRPVHAPQSQTETPHELQEAARQFEAIFLRKMLSSLERTTQMSPKSAQSGQDIYGSFIVDALSSAIAENGGIGLANTIVSSFDGGAGRGAGVKSTPTPEPGIRTPGNAVGSLTARDSTNKGP